MRERWSTASVALHWLGAVLIMGLATAGFVMTDLAPGSGARLLFARMHTVSGATLMLLTVARLIVRWRSPAVAPLPLSAMHRRGVGAIHVLLYIAVFALGASGVATGAQSAWPDYLRGQLAEAPALEALVSRQAHGALALSLLVLVLLHVGGVMVAEIRKGGVLRRMVPFLHSPSSKREAEER